MTLCACVGVRAPVVLGVLAAVILPCGAASAEVIILRSGQVAGSPGVAGQIDDIMTFGGTVPSGPLSPNPFTAADFNATTANPAFVVNAFTSWIPGLTFDPQARWVGTAVVNLPFSPPGLGAPSSALYRVPFNVTTVGITGATISISFAADDNLGDITFGGANPIGAYLRDPGGTVTPLIPVAGGGFGIETQVLNLNITGAIGTGLNELFMYQRDQGSGISGVIFGAELNIVPSPATGAALALLVLARRRRR